MPSSDATAATPAMAPITIATGRGLTGIIRAMKYTATASTVITMPSRATAGGVALTRAEISATATKRLIRTSTGSRSAGQNLPRR